MSLQLYSHEGECGVQQSQQWSCLSGNTVTVPWSMYCLQVFRKKDLPLLFCVRVIFLCQLEWIWQNLITSPVNGEVFGQMSILVHGAASALVQGISLGFFSDFFFLL